MLVPLRRRLRSDEKHRGSSGPSSCPGQYGQNGGRKTSARPQPVRVPGDTVEQALFGSRQDHWQQGNLAKQRKISDQVRS